MNDFREGWVRRKDTGIMTAVCYFKNLLNGESMRCYHIHHIYASKAPTLACHSDQPFGQAFLFLPFDCTDPLLHQKMDKSWLTVWKIQCRLSQCCISSMSWTDQTDIAGQLIPVSKDSFMQVCILPPLSVDKWHDRRQNCFLSSKKT